MPRSRAAASTRRRGPAPFAHGVEDRRRARRRRRRRPAAAGERPRVVVHPLGDRSQAVGPVVHRVHPGDVGEQHLRGADVARCLLPPDVLLPRLQREPNAGRPAASTDTPTSRPGTLRLYSSRARRTRRAGRRSPSAPRNAARTRRPRRRPTPPAGVRTTSARRSAATATNVPWSWRLRTSPRSSRITPVVPGYCSSTPNTPSAGRSGSIAPTTTSIPIGSRACAPPRWFAGGTPRRRRTCCRPSR